MVRLLYATLQRNDCASSTFLVTLCDLEWRWRSFTLVPNIELSHVCHHTKFERNQLTNIQRQAILINILFKITKREFSPLNINHLNKILHEFEWASSSWQHANVHPNWEICWKLMLSLVTVTQNEGQGHSNWYQIILCHHTKFERNWCVNHWISDCLPLLKFYLKKKKICLLIHGYEYQMDPCNESYSSCLAKTLTLDMTRKLFNQFCSYLPCL